MQKNVGSQKAIFFAYDSATNLPKTGDAANITPYESLDWGSVTGITDTSMTEMSSTNAKGYYVCDLTQAETNANIILFSANSTTSGIVVIGAPAVVQTVPLGFTGSVAQTGDSYAVVNSGTFGNAAIKTETASIQSDTNDIQTRIPAALVGGRIDANAGAISGDSTAADNAESFFDGTGYAGTNNIIPTVTTVTNPVAVTSNIRANQALAAIPLFMIDSDGNPLTGLSVTVTRSIDGGAFSAGTLSAVTEVSGGFYKFDAAAGDMNGKVIDFIGVAVGAADCPLTIVTSPA